ncbi:MAG: adenylate/guanylate cyclase domain-containing protein [Armatimonadetes bacterium]|nr:adenylate/guanylate cyclase domain-containing protein [Armatimonadota bacterium]
MGIRDSLKTSATRGRREGLTTGLTIVWVLVALALIPRTREWALFRVPQNWAYDRAIQWQPRQRPQDVIIVAVDERSISRIGRFPWSRKVHAALLQKLKDARAVGFDILFSEAQCGPGGSAADQAFIEAIRKHGRVVLTMHVADNPEVGRRRRPPVELALPVDPERIGLTRPWCVRPELLTPPLRALVEAAAGVGFADVHPDVDGIYRRAELFLSDYTRVYPSFAFELARVAAGLSREEAVSALVRRAVRLGTVLVPFDAGGRVLINYCGPSGTVRRVSYCDVLSGSLPPDTFRDKVVLVGATASGLYDVRPAPFSEQGHFYLGVELNASVCNMLLSGPPLTDLSGNALCVLVGGLVASLAVAAVWLAKEPWVGLLAGAAALAAVASAFMAGFLGAHVVLPAGPALFPLAVAWVWSVYRRIGLERQVIRHHFSAYVSPQVLAYLMSHPELVEQGQRREVTLLFADIRGSTTLAERIPPTQWITQLNEYLTEMSEIILGFEGYLDKFMGDGIMAIWNAFGGQVHHRDLALRAAIAMLERLEQLNSRWDRTPGRTPLRIGIGIHTGEAIVGNVGSQERTQFTAIGDTVNAAARIENATKEFGVSLIVSEATVAGLAGRYNLAELGVVHLRGRDAPVRLFTLNSLKGGQADVMAQEASQAPH